MSKRRSSLTMVSPRHKLRHIFEAPEFNRFRHTDSLGELTKLIRKRLRETNVFAEPAFKRTAYDRPSDIYLKISEIDEPKQKISNRDIYLHPSFWASYMCSVDLREFAALDIQRVFKGWSFRRKHRNASTLNNMFLSLSI